MADYTFGVLFLLIILLGAAGTAGYAVRIRTEDDEAMDGIVLEQARD